MMRRTPDNRARIRLGAWVIAPAPLRDRPLPNAYYEMSAVIADIYRQTGADHRFRCGLGWPFSGRQAARATVGKRADA
jgi:hypothetical protein